MIRVDIDFIAACSAALFFLAALVLIVLFILSAKESRK